MQFIVNELNTTLLAIVMVLLGVVVLLLIFFSVVVRNNTSVMTLTNTRMSELTTAVNASAKDTSEIKGSTTRIENAVGVLIQRPNG